MTRFKTKFKKVVSKGNAQINLEAEHLGKPGDMKLLKDVKNLAQVLDFLIKEANMSVFDLADELSFAVAREHLGVDTKKFKEIAELKAGKLAFKAFEGRGIGSLLASNAENALHVLETHYKGVLMAMFEDNFKKHLKMDG